MSAIACGNCGAVLPAGTKFCGRCGTQLASAAPAAPVGPPSTGLPDHSPSLEPDRSATSLRGDRRPWWPIALVAVLVVVAVGGSSWFLFFSGAGGGASDPETAVREFVDAVNGDDPLLIVQSVAPSEVEGVADLLERLRERLGEQGLDTWSSDGSSFDLTIDLVSMAIVEQADHAALVEVDGVVSIVGIDWPGPLDAVLDDRYELDLADVAEELDERGVDELTIATVRESGGWYVSPMLTAANLGAELADLPAADLDRVGEELDRTARDGAEAIETAIDAAVRLEFEELATVVTPAVSRLLLAFEDVLDDLRDEADEEGYRVADVDVDLSELSDGEYAVDDVEFEAATFNDTVRLRVRDDCLEVDGGDEGCVLDEFPGDLDVEQLVLQTVEVDGGYVVDPVASVADRIADVIESVDYRHVLDVFGLAVFDDATVATIGVPVEIDFDGRPYVVLEYTTSPGDRVAVSLLDGVGWTDLFVEADDGVWRSRWWTQYDDIEGDTVRVVVEAPIEDCGPVFCERETEESATVVLHTAHRQDIGDPDQVVAGSLAGGDGYVFSFEVTSRGRYGFDVVEGDVEATVVDAGVDVTGDVFSPGSYELHVWNRSNAETTFRVEPRAR